MKGWSASMPVLQILAKEIYLASLKHLATGYISTKCPPTKIIVQESVDRHSDLDNLHWERPTPGPQCSSPSLLLHAPQAHYTHQVRWNYLKHNVSPRWKDLIYDISRWMPEGEEDISWPWIKEALPSIPLTKVSYFLSYVFHRRWVFWQPCALCRTSLSFPWSWPHTPSAIWLLWTSLKTTYHRCQNKRNVVTLLLPGPWKTSARPGSHLLPGEGKRRGIWLPRSRECCLQHRYLKISQQCVIGCLDLNNVIWRYLGQFDPWPKTCTL